MPRFLVRTCLFFLLTVIYSFSQAQQTSSYQLLWKIAGGGLAEPSYLFGTMHVKDIRAFDFSDSVMTSIEKCKIFALEVDPDTMIRAMFDRNMIKDNEYNMDSLFSEEEMGRLRERFLEINGYEYDDLSNKNPNIIRRLIRPDLESPDDKETFVDAYLYGIAKTLGKELVGLEDVETQLDLMQEDSEEEQRKVILDILDYDLEAYEDYMNDMIEVYSSGDLDVLEAMVGPSNMKDPVSLARNKVMADRMHELMQQDPTFTAVGAAHLPGDEGIISLLRSKGYTLSPVKASFTGIAEKYSIDFTKIKWPTYQDDTLGFSIDMPGTPFPDMRYDPMKMLMYTDLATGAFYSVFTLDMRSVPGEINEDNMYKNFMKRFRLKEGTEVVRKKKISKKDLSGMEVILKTSESIRMKLQIWSREKVFYFLMAGKSDKALEKPYVTRFFDSFATTNLPPVKETKWFTYKNEQGAFSVDLPVEPKEQELEIKNPLDPEGETFKVKLYVAVDVSTMTNYIFGYNDFPVGYYLQDPDESLANMAKELETKGELLGPVDTIFLDGKEGREIRIRLMGKSYMQGRFIVRGNRIYRIFKQNLKENDDTLIEDQFFPSFQFTPYDTSELVVEAPEDFDFQFKRFTPSAYEIDTTVDHTNYFGNISQYASTNPNSGGVYLLEKYEFDKFFKLQHVDSFYTEVLEGLKSWSDTLVQNKSIKIGAYDGRDIVLADRYSGQKVRYRFWMDSQMLCYMMAYVDEDELFSETTNEYFESVKYTKEPIARDLYRSQSQEILKGLLSSDTTVLKSAQGALSFYTFEKDELPGLEEAVLLTYPDDSSSYGTRPKLIGEIGTLQEESSLEKLKKLYTEPGITEAIRNSILYATLAYDNDAGLATFLELFLNDPPQDSDQAWKLFSPFTDSLELAAKYYAQLIPFLQNENYQQNVLWLSRSLLAEETGKYKSLVDKHFESLTQFLEKDLNEYKAELANEDEYSYNRKIYGYLSFFELSESHKIMDTFTAELLNMNVPDYQKGTAMAIRIKNSFSLDKKHLQELFKEEDTRYYLVDAFIKADRLKEVPKKYRTPEAIAHMSTRYFLCEDDGCPDEMRLLGTLPKDDASVYVFSFTYSYGEEESTYIILTGPLNSDPKTFNLDEIKSYNAWEEMTKDWETAAKKMLENFDENGY